MEYGVDFRTCPVGVHCMHGKMEREIQQIKKSMAKELDNRHLSNEMENPGVANR